MYGRRLASLIVAGDLVTAGQLADGAVGDFVAIVGGCVGVGAGVGTAYEWFRRLKPDWGAAAGRGSLGGLFIGVLLAILDAGSGG